MDTTREKSRTYEEIRDKYFYLVYRIQERYGLDEDGLSELTIRYCEFIHENLHRDWQWSGRLQGALVNRTKKLLKDKALCGAPESVSFQDIRGTSDEATTQDLEGVAEAYDALLLRKALANALDTLTPREADILRKRFYQKKNYDACADEYSVSSNRIRQIEAKGLRKLRHPCRRDPLLPFVGLEAKTRRICQPVHEVFQYNIGINAVISGSVEVSGPVNFEACPIAENSTQYVVRVLVETEKGFFCDNGLRVVGLADATRYNGPSVPTWISEYLNGKSVVIKDGRLGWADGRSKW